MVYANINDTAIKGPYQEINKGKRDDRTSSGQHQEHNRQTSQPKNDKYGAWGPVYKNKQNFVDMHIC